MRRTVRLLTLGVIALVAAPACGDAFGVEDILGVWNTMSINGYDVPGTVVYEGDSHDTQYVRWALYDGGQCTLTQRVDGFTETYDDCEFTVNVGLETIALAFQSQTWAGSVEGDRMTLTDPQDIVWILRKQ